MKSYTLPVLDDDEGKYIQFPEEELKELGWGPNTILEWVDNLDGTFTLRKKNMDFINKVLDFNRIAGASGEFDQRRVALYYGLIMEELAESIAACENRPAFDHMISTLNHWSKRFKEGDFDKSVANVDRVEALDGFIDLAVVAIGGADALGSDVQGAAHEVMDSNLSKFVMVNGVLTALKDENGKVKKAEGYFRPELAKFVK